MNKEEKKIGKANKLWTKVLKFLAVTMSINTIVTFVSAIVKKSFFQKALFEDDACNLVQLYGSIIGIVLVILYIHCFEKRTMASLGIKNRHIFRKYIKGIYIGTLLLSIIVMTGVLSNVLNFEGMNENANIKIILLFFGGFLLQGLYEELIFRGYFMTSITGKNPIFISVFLNSIIFGFVHGFNNGFQAFSLLNLILFGIFESIYWLKAGSIWECSAVHTMWNFVQGPIYGFHVSGVEQPQSLFEFKIKNCELLNGGTFGLEGSLLTTVVLVSAIVIAALLKKERWNEVSA